MDIRLALMTGVDIPIPQCQLTIHQPTIKEISYIGDEDFFKGVQCLCLHKTMFVQDKAALEEINNFQIFMMIMSDKTTADKKDAVQSLLTLLFPQYKVMFTPRSLVFSQKDQEPKMVDETNFDFLQDVLRIIFCSKNGPMDQQAFNPANAKAKEIADKLMRGRQRVAAQNGTANSSIFAQYLSVLAVGLESMGIAELINLTMFQLYDLIERYNLYTNWDIDIRSRLAGAKIDKPPENWMKNIHT